MNSKDNNRGKGKKTVRKPTATAARSSTAVKTAQKRGGTVSTGNTAHRRSRTKSHEQAKPAPEVVYTQPGPFNRGRFLLQLFSAVAVVLAVLFTMSLFFKVEHVVVSGAEKYTPWQIKEAAEIENGDNLLTQNEAMIGGKIRATLPYVNKVRVGIKLPDTVNIEIEELDVVYSIEGNGGSWWLISGAGTVLESTNAADALDYTQILGVTLASPVPGETAKAFEPIPEEPETTAATDASGEAVTTPETVPVKIPAAQQLSVALDIVQYLEDNGILGEAASVNVADLLQLEVWYGQRYHVLLGDTTQLSHKIITAKLTIDQLGEYHSGILDVSFTLRENDVLYTPFS